MKKGELCPKETTGVERQETAEEQYWLAWWASSSAQASQHSQHALCQVSKSAQKYLLC